MMMSSADFTLTEKFILIFLSCRIVSLCPKTANPMIQLRHYMLYIFHIFHLFNLLFLVLLFTQYMHKIVEILHKLNSLCKVQYFSLNMRITKNFFLNNNNNNNNSSTA